MRWLLPYFISILLADNAGEEINDVLCVISVILLIGSVWR